MLPILTRSDALGTLGVWDFGAIRTDCLEYESLKGFLEIFWKTVCRLRALRVLVKVCVLCWKKSKRFCLMGQNVRNGLPGKMKD